MQVKDKVFILKKTKYGESDLILQCLSPRGARLSLFARSALKSRKRFGGGVLEPTHYVNVVYDEKRDHSNENTLHTLKEASLIESFDSLRTDYSRLEAGLHFLRLVSSISREGEIDSDELFNLLGNALRAAETSQHLDWLRLHFEVKILAHQGVLPLEAEEDLLLKTPLAEHGKISLSERAWALLQLRVRRVLTEYLGKAH